jgi:TPR repeat protein
MKDAIIHKTARVCRMKKMLIVFFLVIGANLSADLVSDGLVAHSKGDYDKANKLYLESCDQGNSKGCLALGSLYALGHGVDIDVVTAKKFFKKACEGGNKRGCINFDFYNVKPETN